MELRVRGDPQVRPEHCLGDEDTEDDDDGVSVPSGPMTAQKDGLGTMPPSCPRPAPG